MGIESVKHEAGLKFLTLHLQTANDDGESLKYCCRFQASTTKTLMSMLAPSAVTDVEGVLALSDLWDADAATIDHAIVAGVIESLQRKDVIWFSIVNINPIRCQESSAGHVAIRGRRRRSSPVREGRR
jgi:hypothetical protein